VKKIILVFMLLFPALSHADDNYLVKQAKSWTWQDTALVGIGETLTVLDMGQTRYIATHPQSYQETNAILGQHPTPQAVTGYFLGVAALIPIVHFLVPEEYRGIAAGVYIGVEAASVSSNYQVGIRTSF
jgi:hypothetical protein